MPSRLNTDEYFLTMLRLVAARSTCVRRAVGAILTDEAHHILSTGYSGVPKGVPHCIDKPCPGAKDAKGDTRRCMAVHAEVNAVIQCSRFDLAHTLYVSTTPCFSCAKMLANTNVKRVVCLEQYADQDGALLLKQVGIAVEVIHA